MVQPSASLLSGRKIESACEITRLIANNPSIINSITLTRRPTLRERSREANQGPEGGSRERKPSGISAALSLSADGNDKLRS